MSGRKLDEGNSEIKISGRVNCKAKAKMRWDSHCAAHDFDMKDQDAPPGCNFAWLFFAETFAEIYMELW